MLRPSQMQGRTWNANEPYSAETAKPLTYIWSDRGIYRTGRTMSFAGIDRDLVLGSFAPVPGKFRIDLVNGSEDSEPVAPPLGLPPLPEASQARSPCHEERGAGRLVPCLPPPGRRSGHAHGQRLRAGGQLPARDIYGGPQPARRTQVHR